MPFSEEFQPRMSPTNSGGLGKETRTDQPISIQEISKVPPDTRLLDFFAKRPEQQYQLLTQAKHGEIQQGWNGYKAEAMDGFGRFAAVIDTLTFLPFAQRFDMFVHHVYKVISIDNRRLQRNNTVSETATMLHINNDVLENGKDALSEPLINLAFSTSLNLFDMSSRAKQKGHYFIPTELHIRLQQLFTNPDYTNSDWEEIAEQVSEYLGNRYPDLTYISFDGLYKRLRKAQLQLVDAGELAEEYRTDRQQAKSLANRQRVLEAYEMLLDTQEHTVSSISRMTGLSKHAIRTHLEQLGLEPKNTSTEAKRKAQAINAAVSAMIADGIPWGNIQFWQIADILEDQGISMSPRDVKNFIDRHREQYFSHLPARRLSKEEIMLRNREIFIDYANGTNQQDLAEKYNLGPHEISEILRGTPPLDEEGNPHVYEPRLRRSFSPEERERILELYREQEANGTAGIRGSLNAIVDVINAEREAQGNPKKISKSAVDKILRAVRRQS